MLCATAPSLFQQERSPATDPKRDKDVQVIYSWVISHSTGPDKLYLVAPETSQSDYPQEHCLAIPPGHASDFREIRADFEGRKNTTREIPRSISPSKPYVILDPSVAHELLKAAVLSESPIVREHYPGAEHLLLFSDVYLNQKRTVALVHVESWCGGLCAHSIWMAFEKGNDGMWQFRPWAHACPVIAFTISSKEL